MADIFPHIPASVNAATPRVRFFLCQELDVYQNLCMRKLEPVDKFKMHFNITPTKQNTSDYFRNEMI